MAWNGQDFDFFVHFWFDNRMFLLKVILIIILKSLKASQTCRIWFWPDRNRYSWSWRLDFARFFIKSSLTLSHSNFYNSEVRNFPLIEFYKIFRINTVRAMTQCQRQKICTYDFYLRKSLRKYFFDLISYSYLCAIGITYLLKLSRRDLRSTNGRSQTLIFSTNFVRN